MLSVPHCVIGWMTVGFSFRFFHSRVHGGEIFLLPGQVSQLLVFLNLKWPNHFILSTWWEVQEAQVSPTSPCSTTGGKDYLPVCAPIFGVRAL